MSRPVPAGNDLELFFKTALDALADVCKIRVPCNVNPTDWPQGRGSWAIEAVAGLVKMTKSFQKAVDKVQAERRIRGLG